MSKILHLLVADDDRDICIALKHIFEDHLNATVKISSTFKNAVTKVIDNRFDLIIIDRRDCDGLLFVEELRSGKFGDNNRNIPVIVWTGVISRDLQIAVDKYRLLHPEKYINTWLIDRLISNDALINITKKALNIQYNKESIKHIRFF